MSKKMTFEDALDVLEMADAHMSIAYKKLMRVSKECPKKSGYPLKDIIIGLGTATLTLGIVRAEYGHLTDLSPNE